MEVGDLIEVTGVHAKQRTEGIVTKLGYIYATVQPVDSNTLEEIGEAFEINRGLLTRNPSRTEITRELIKFRQQHLAELKSQSHLRPGNIRIIKREDGRKQRPHKDY